MTARIGIVYNVSTGLSEDVEETGFEISEPALALPDISDRQFFQQLAVEYISESEALAAVATGTLPGAVETIVINMPPRDQFAARMLLSGASSFERNHPLVGIFASTLGMDDAQLDTFWLAASKLR
ncbi:hypothetical protein GHL01_00395 [Sinorhizobium meliloti]|uniref:hypothetical protein n=1 Tax=Rhizobium meliloti TaxID=382 RepID=UPI001296BEEB|nr:hypothetical protein [Sinorhizobium meliloti]MQV12204.1 hypothetical protein [Sinorhizobium meliloti]